ncbi:MAG: hypothetical protein RBU21_23555, partial [FCB group bacterium]|nr:hypothetical protein [FCB group bacterium]
MALALVVGYWFFQSNQVSSVKDRLLIDVEKNAMIVRLALDSQWKGLERMAKNPQLNTFLAGRKTTAQPIPDLQLQSFFESYFANSPDDESTERVSLGKAIIAV